MLKGFKLNNDLRDKYLEYSFDSMYSYTWMREEGSMEIIGNIFENPELLT
jgi:hypothetical protein